MSPAGWDGAETYRKYYNKPLLKSERFRNILFPKSCIMIYVVLYGDIGRIKLCLCSPSNCLKFHVTSL